MDYQSCLRPYIVCVLGLILHGPHYSRADILGKEFTCAAPDYLSQAAPSISSVEFDTSCFTTAPEQRNNLNVFQVVEVYQKRGDIASAVDNSLYLSAYELANKSYLKKKQLLLFSKDFSRVNASLLCAKLREEGFVSVTFLLDGVRALGRLYNHAKFSPQRALFIEANELRHELFRGRVVIFTDSESSLEALALLGVSAQLFGQTVDQLKFQELTQSGILPAVWISDQKGDAPAWAMYQSNFYVLDGGLTSVTNAASAHEWVNRRRTGVPNRFQCAAG